MKKFVRRSLFLLVCIFVPLIAGEVFVRIVWPSSVDEKAAFLVEARRNHQEQRLYDGPLMSGYIAHPFWGYQANPNFPNVNNYGFRETQNLPYKAAPNEVVVGLFGGSVALNSSSDLKTALENPAMPLSCGRKIKLLNFSLEGHRQPSQMNAFAYFIEDLDLSINLDGNNELEATNSENLPVGYPEFYHQLFQSNAEKVSLLQKAYTWEQRRLGFSEILAKYPAISGSDLGFFLSKNFLNWMLNKKIEILYEDVPALTKAVKPLDGQRDLDEGIRSWAKYTSMQSSLAKNRKIPALFFIQPSQYSPELKPFGEAEARVALKNDLFEMKRLQNGFVALRQSGEALAAQGVDVIDLISLFSNTKEAIFVDDCCHINSEGNRILVERIVSEVAKRINQKPCGIQ